MHVEAFTLTFQILGAGSETRSTFIVISTSIKQSVLVLDE